MGACFIGGEFKAYDWREGIRAEQEAAIYEHGNDSYNGTCSTVSFRYAGDFSKKTKAQLDKYEREMKDNLGKRDGVVYLVKHIETHVVTTVFKKVKAYKGDEVLRKGSGSPYVVIEDNDYMGRKVIFKGKTLKECKDYAHNWLHKNKYKSNLLIVGRPSVMKGENILCRDELKKYKNTTKHTDDKQLVLSLDEYVYFGWAAE